MDLLERGFDENQIVAEYGYFYSHASYKILTQSRSGVLRDSSIWGIPQTDSENTN